MAACKKVNTLIHLNNCDKLCRLCGYYLSPMLSILIKDSTDTTYRDKIVYCMSIEVSDSGKLSTQICQTCAKLLETFYTFKMKCIDVNLQLMELMKKDESEDTDSKNRPTSKDLVLPNQQSTSSSPTAVQNVREHFCTTRHEINSRSTTAQQVGSTCSEDSPVTSGGCISYTGIQENLLQKTHRLESTVARIQPHPSPVLCEVSAVKTIKIEAGDTSPLQTDPLELVTCSYANYFAVDRKPNTGFVPVASIFNNNNETEKRVEPSRVDATVPFEPSRSIETTCVACGATFDPEERLVSDGSGPVRICLACSQQTDQRNENNKTLECKIRSKTLQSESTLFEHSKRHSRSNEPMCGLKCEGDDLLRTHLASKHGEFGDLTCPFCEKTNRRRYKSAKSFSAHMRKLHNVVVGSASGAKGTSRSSTQSEGFEAGGPESHIDKGPVSRGGEKKTKMTQCEKVFNEKQKDSVSRGGEKKTEDAQCEKVFDEKQTSADRVDPLKKGNSKAKRKDACLCSYCGKIFGTTTLLSQHVRMTHLRLKTHKCSQCDKCYGKSSALRNHVEAVHDKKKFQCSLCGALLSSFNGLHSHARMHRNKDRPPAVRCPVCPKVFRHKKNVDRHLRTHTGETPFGCSHCPRRFTLEWNLIQHERLHTGEKRYVCDKCGKAFTHNVSRKNHMKYHKDDL